jgi:uncharacterized protein YbjT (DUF2867 family)
MPERKTVFVTGATGKQGGAVAKALLDRGHRVVALTRSVDTPAAAGLARAGASVVQGDFDKPGALADAMNGVDTAFLMSTPYGTSTEDEARQGIALVDAARAAGLGHVIYSSVASADRNTGIPHFEGKFTVEQHLAKGAGDWTVSAPVAFMDFAGPLFLDGLRAEELRMAVPASRPVQYVAVPDIGAFVAELVERREAVFGRRIEIAGDELNGEQTAAILSQVIGRKIRYVPFPPDVLRRFSDDLALMFEWFDQHGYEVDRAALRREFPELRWRSLSDWAKEQDWRSALSTAA